MKREFAFACMLLSALLISGCGGTGADDNGNDWDGIIVIDYGAGDDSVRPDNHVYPDVVIYDDEGNPIDLGKPDNGGGKDTNVPKDEGGVDTKEEDTTVSDFCTVPVNCPFETVNNIRDNCDGTFTDLSSGLMWQGTGEDHPLAATNSNMMSRQCNTTKTGCNNGRYWEDWRMPTIEEVRTLVRGCPKTEEGGACPAADACRDFSTCLTADCNGCGNGGDFEYVDGSDTYNRYIDPRMESVGYGISYSAVMSSSTVNKTTSDTRYRFYYILNYNAKLAALNPMQEATEGVMFCVRGPN